MKDCEFFLVTAWDGEKWGEDELQQHNFVPRVRQLLGGRWEKMSEYDTMIHAYFNESNQRGSKRVLVIGFPPSKGWTREKALQTLQNIREGREDLS